MPHLSIVSNRIRRRPVSSFRGGNQIGGSGGGSVPLTSETPTGAVDGVNTDYTLSATPTSLLLFRNGVLQALDDDYTLAGATITFAAAPQTGDVLFAVIG